MSIRAMLLPYDSVSRRAQGFSVGTHHEESQIGWYGITIRFRRPEPAAPEGVVPIFRACASTDYRNTCFSDYVAGAVKSQKDLL